MRALKIRIKDRHIIKYLEHKLFLTQHFENMMIILINQDFNQNCGNNFKYLTNGRIMRAVFTGNSGGRLKDQVDYVKNYYKNNCLMNDLIAVCKDLKIHNIVEQIKNIKKNYKATFTKSINGDYKTNKPAPKSLKSANHITLYMDGYKSITLKHTNLIGLNLNDKMIYTHVKHEALLKLIDNLKNIKNINLNYSNGNIYMLINYEKETSSNTSSHNIKYAGLDIGIRNIVSLYIHDTTTNSLIINGSRYISYNSSFNRLISNLDKTINSFRFSNEEHRITYLNNYKRYLYEKRVNFFFSEFHKLSKYILLYLKNSNVTHLIVSKTIAKLKNNGKCKINKTINQHFMQIPLIKLIDYISLKASDYGIKSIEIDESYTSKTSCLSSNIIKVKSLSNTSMSTDVFGGRRVNRGLFKDYKYNKLLNADLNASCNICKCGALLNNTFEDFKAPYFKLCNPIKLNAIAI